MSRRVLEPAPPDRRAGRLIDLQHECEVAEAKLSVAENFSVPVAGLVGWLSYLLTEHWLASLAAVAFAYVASLSRPQAAARRAADAFEKEARLWRPESLRAEAFSELAHPSVSGLRKLGEPAGQRGEQPRS